MKLLQALRARFPRTLEKRHVRRAAVLMVVLPIGLVVGEALIRAHLPADSGRPSTVRIYGRPVVLEQGQGIDRGNLRSHLQRLGYREATGDEVGIGEYYLGSRGMIVGRRPFRAVADLAPSGFVLARLDYRGRITRMEDEDGARLREALLEPELLHRLANRSTEDRMPVALEEIPPHLIAALLKVEDQRFFQHFGLDIGRIGAAAVANMKAGRVVQGGSTLTQQLAKNLFLSSKRSIVRKIREAAMAVALEMRYSKDEILEAYLNQVYLAQDGAVGIHGVGRAARHFFGKDVTTLDLSESALLVALIRAPSLYSPFRNPETARNRRNLVLSLMRDGGSISDDRFEQAVDAPLGLRSRTPPIRSARYFSDFVVKSMDTRADLNAVVTTLDPRLQRLAEDAVRDGLARLERDFSWLRQKEGREPLQAALVALDPRTGEILAMVGGREYGVSQFNRATSARRQPGSAFKPVVALSALARTRVSDEERVSDGGGSSDVQWAAYAEGEDGDTPFTLASILRDEPFSLETPAGTWEPSNYDRSYEGPVTLRDALERSLNVPFARLGVAVGPETVVETAKAMGIESPLDPFPAIALGASEVSPLELTRAFGVLAAGGFRADLKTILAVAGRDGVSERVGNARSGTTVFDGAETYLVTSALRGAVERGTGRGIRDQGFFGDVAAKSGTTNGFRDGWFVGYTPTLAVGVWVGFDHGQRLELPGAGVALPIFAHFLEGAVGASGETGPWGSRGFSLPDGLEVVDIDPETGLRGGWGCGGEPELFLEGTAPMETCSGFRWSDRTLRRLLERVGEDGPEALRRLLRRLGLEDEVRIEWRDGREPSNRRGNRRDPLR